jgi:hypothetical protein
MPTVQYNEYNLPVDGYAAFDAVSLKNLIIARLNANQVFTDQNIEGSNMSAVIDIIAYAYHVLLFYLNRTGAESTFTTAELYENVNKIVKLIGYAPIGYQTAILPFNAAATAALQPNTYTIPRYSYFTLNGQYYSFNKDVTFVKATNGYEILTDFQDQNLLYQGRYSEYPTYTANGQPFETVTLTIVDLEGNNAAVDHFNIDVYVRSNSVTNPIWEKWSSTHSLFLERSNANAYEVRLNENLRYEFKFGNNVTGKQLAPGDEVAVYYLRSSKEKGEIGTNVLNGNQLFYYTTARFSTIQANTTPVNVNLLSQSQASTLVFTNPNPSTKFVDVESVDSIKTNSLNTFRSQYRLITTGDFETYLSKNFSNLFASVKAVNNWDYLTGHMKYYFDLGVTRPNLESRVLFNQIKFADSSNANNIYVYAVPKLEKVTSLSTRTNYLNTAQKQLIINDLTPVKLTTSEIVVTDPVFMAVDLGVRIADETLGPDSTVGVKLNLIRDITAKQNPQSLKDQVANIFKIYFSTTSDNLGLLLSISELTNLILNVPGITDISTTKVGVDGSTYTIPGLGLILFNPVYPYNDVHIITQDTQLPYFKYPYLNDSLNFINKINVVTPSIQQLAQ